jgi:hypothetical protein
VVVRLAIAQALTEHDNNRIDSRAARLKDRRTCPPEVVAYLANRLKG